MPRHKTNARVTLQKTKKQKKISTEKKITKKIKGCMIAGSFEIYLYRCCMPKKKKRDRL